jgi:hypothetical protein
MSLSVQLSAGGLQNVSLADDFSFILGRERYRCPSPLAAFLSPKVAELLQSDPTCDSFAISVADPSRNFPDILNLARGAEITIEAAGIAFVTRIARELGSAELYSKIADKANEPLTVANVLYRLELADEFALDSADEIAFLASQFHSLPPSFFQRLPVDILSRVLAHPMLKITNEDSLYELIYSCFQADPQYLSLFEFVRFELLSIQMIREFIGTSQKVEFLNGAIWQRICSRLALPAISLGQRPSNFVFDADAPLNGMIAHLTRVCSRNVHDSGVVLISASSTISVEESYQGKNLADLGTDSIFHSGKSLNQWVCYDFRDMRVIPNYYTIRTHYAAEKGRSHPRSWVIEGSSDGKCWTVIDSRQTDELDGPNLVRSFPIENQSKWRMVRLRQTETNHGGTHYLTFSAWELFGSLVE